MDSKGRWVTKSDGSLVPCEIGGGGSSSGDWGEDSSLWDWMLSEMLGGGGGGASGGSGGGGGNGAAPQTPKKPCRKFGDLFNAQLMATHEGIAEGLSAVGVPKSITNKIANSKTGLIAGVVGAVKGFATFAGLGFGSDVGALGTLADFTGSAGIGAVGSQALEIAGVAAATSAVIEGGIVAGSASVARAQQVGDMADGCE